MIKKITEKDLLIWARMAATVYNDTTDEDVIEENARELLGEYRDGRFPNEYGYFLDNDLVAFISLSKRNEYVNGTESSPVGYIEGIYVDLGYRNRRIGQDLVEFAKKWSKDNGCAELASDCLLENTNSYLFHTSVGFEETERVIYFRMKL